MTPRDADARHLSGQNSGAGRRQQAGNSRHQELANFPNNLIPSNSIAQALAAVYAPAVPLASLPALLASDASPEEIRRRLRLNLAIRILLEALAEHEEVRP